MWDPEASYLIKPLEGWLEKKGEIGVSLYLKANQQRRYFRTAASNGVPCLLYYASASCDEPLGQIYFGKGITTNNLKFNTQCWMLKKMTKMKRD